jgi:hypothetical protein
MPEKDKPAFAAHQFTLAKTFWVNFCRVILWNARPLYPTKLPPRPFAIEAASGQERP